MGTWGTGPFSSDGALDLLEELTELEQGERRERLAGILSTTIENPESMMRTVFPDEVVAAAALVAVSLPGGERIVISQKEAVANELAGAVLSAPAFDLVRPALNALLSVAGPNGAWHRGWVDDDRRESAKQNIEEILTVLQAKYS